MRSESGTEASGVTDAGARRAADDEIRGAGARDAETRAATGEVEIAASPERVWRALTEGAELERWFPLEARVEPGEGGSVFMSWKNEYAGESEILAWEPPERLSISWGWSEEGPVQVTEYRIETRGGRTFLRVVTSGFPADSAWDEWVEGTNRGWHFELASLKHYLETHDGLDREVVYLRRRIGLGRREAWERLFGPDGFGDRPLEGRPFDESPPVQYAAIVEDPPEAMLRISVEPSYVGPDARDVTLWLSAWGEHGERLGEIEREWRGRLESLFPEGEMP